MIKTIGHSNHPIGRFVDLLKAGGVEAVVDVRSTPYSRRFPQFGRERLAQSLSAAGILYRYEGAGWAENPRTARATRRWPGGRSSRRRSTGWSRARPTPRSA